MSTFKFTVLSEEDGQRLDKFLADRSGVSRNYVQKLVDKPSRKVRGGEEISFTVPETEPLKLEPYDFPLDIIFENDDMLVINKPVGLTVHPAPGNYDKTLVHALLHHCKGSLSGINGVERPGIVHRLDKDTSGLMVVAKNDAAHRKLAEGIEKREIGRRYKAVICGFPSTPSGVIETIIGRHPKDRKKMAVLLSGGKEAVTEYRIIEILNKGKATLIECKLQTGRTHQIRVHMQHIGHPIVGDVSYGNKRKMAGIPEFSRQALHAYKLIIPDIGEFESDLPQDMQELIEKIKTYKSEN